MNEPKLVLIRPKSSSEVDLREAAEKLYAALTGKGNRQQPVEPQSGCGPENEGSGSENSIEGEAS